MSKLDYSDFFVTLHDNKEQELITTYFSNYKWRCFYEKFKSIQTAINPQTNKSIPLWLLDTITNTVIHYDADTHKESVKTYHSDSVKYHISFSASKYPDRLRKLVNNGQIIVYLDDLE